MYIFAAENVSLANPASVQRREMAGRRIVDVDEIEAGIDKAGHASAGGLHDDASCRRRLDVAGTDRGRRIDDHRRQPGALDHVVDQALGQHLALLVGSDRLIGRKRPVLVRRLARVQPDRRHTAGIDDPLDAGP